MELFVTKSRKYGNCCCSYYGVIRLKCDRAPRSASETQINLNKRIKYSIRHLHVQSLQKTLETCQIYSRLIIKTPERCLFIHC